MSRPNLELNAAIKANSEKVKLLQSKIKRSNRNGLVALDTMNNIPIVNWLSAPIGAAATLGTGTFQSAGEYDQAVQEVKNLESEIKVMQARYTQEHNDNINYDLSGANFAQKEVKDLFGKDNSLTTSKEKES